PTWTRASSRYVSCSSTPWSTGRSRTADERSRSGWPGSDRAAEQQLPRHERRLQLDLQAHLGRAEGALLEADRHLGDGDALAHRPVVHLHLERVAVALDGAHVDGAQGVGLPGLETGGGVLDAEAEDQVDVEVGPGRERLAVPLPLLGGGPA